MTDPRDLAYTSRRYRCDACGNLTRFDVVTDRRERSYYHYSLGGDLRVEDTEVISEEVVEVSCRWCGHGRSVVIIDSPSEQAEHAGSEA